MALAAAAQAAHPLCCSSWPFSKSRLHQPGGFSSILLSFQIGSYLDLIKKSLSYFGSLKELFRDTIRLNTGAPGLLSWLSAQKYPFRTNWKLS